MAARVVVYPTGVPGEGGAAIPQTDAEHVIEDTIAVATLAAPITFGSMGGGGAAEVSTVCVVALKDPERQAGVVQRITRVVQDATLLQSLAGADRTTIAGLVAEAVGATGH